MSDSLWPHEAYQDSPSMGFSRQEYPSGLPIPSTSDKKKKKKKSAYKCRRHWFDPWIKKIPLEKGMATHSSILAWKYLGQRSPVCCSPRGRKELDETEGLGGRSSKILPWKLVRSSAKWMRFKHLSQTEEISMTVAQEVSFALNLV